MAFVFLTANQVERLHDRALAAHGGLPGVRDRNALESAVQRPRDAAYYRPDASTAELAASLAYGLAKNHAFNDANKRTSLACTGVFLRLNDCRIVASNQDLYESWVLLAEGGLSEGDLATWLDRRLVTIDNPHFPLR